MCTLSLSHLISYERDTTVHVSIKDHSAIGSDESGVDRNERGGVCVVVEPLSAHVPATNFVHRCYMDSLSHLYTDKHQDRVTSHIVIVGQSACGSHVRST